MLFELQPLQGAGPLQLGMTHDETHDVLTTLGNPLWMCLGGYWSTYRSSGLTIRTKFFNGVLDSISFEGPLDDNSDHLRYSGIDLFATPAPSVIEALGWHMHAVKDREYWYEVPELGLYLGSEDDTFDEVFDLAKITLPDPD